MYSWDNNINGIFSTYTFLYLYMVHKIYKDIKIYCY